MTDSDDTMAYSGGFDTPPRNVHPEAWHLDKKVPIGIIGALVVQTIVLVYVGTTWKVDVESRLKVLERSDERSEPQEARLIVVEQKLGYIQESLRRIEGVLILNSTNGSAKQDFEGGR